MLAIHYLFICLMLLLFTCLLSQLHHGIWLVARNALVERIHGRPYCLHGGHALFILPLIYKIVLFKPIALYFLMVATLFTNIATQVATSQNVPIP